MDNGCIFQPRRHSFEISIDSRKRISMPCFHQFQYIPLGSCNTIDALIFHNQYTFQPTRFLSPNKLYIEDIFPAYLQIAPSKPLLSGRVYSVGGEIIEHPNVCIDFLLTMIPFCFLSGCLCFRCDPKLFMKYWICRLLSMMH